MKSALGRATPSSEGIGVLSCEDESRDAFDLSVNGGIINVGYTDATSYAYPGGLKLAVINPQ